MIYDTSTSKFNLRVITETHGNHNIRKQTRETASMQMGLASISTTAPKQYLSQHTLMEIGMENLMGIDMVTFELAPPPSSSVPESLLMQWRRRHQQLSITVIPLRRSDSQLIRTLPNSQTLCWPRSHPEGRTSSVISFRTASSRCLL